MQVQGSIFIVQCCAFQECFISGECQDTVAAIGHTATPEACHAFCHETGYNVCHYWTHYAGDELCVLFEECATFSESTCTDCTSGEFSCDDPSALTCDAAGLFKGILVGHGTAPNRETCVHSCQEEPQCEYWTFDTDLGSCYLFATDTGYEVSSCETCVTGERDCKIRKNSCDLSLKLHQNPFAQHSQVPSVCGFWVRGRRLRLAP